MEIAVDNKNDLTVLKLTGRMDAVTSSNFDKQVTELIGKHQVKLVVNMQNLEYISSAGLRSILAATKKLRAEQGDMVFCNLQGHVAEVFQISGLTALFKISDSEDKAVNEFN